MHMHPRESSARIEPSAELYTYSGTMVALCSGGPGSRAFVRGQDSPPGFSARQPVPVQLRAAGPGLRLCSVSHHRGRPSSERVAARTAARDVEAPAAGIPSSSNGHHAPAPLNLGTASVHGGERSGRPRVADALTTPIVQTSTYWFRNTAELIDFNEGRMESFEYGRYGNPTVQAVENKIKALEGAEDALMSASGMNSVTSMLLSLVPAGGHIVTTSDCYWRTRQFMVGPTDGSVAGLPAMNWLLWERGP